MIKLAYNKYYMNSVLSMMKIWIVQNSVLSLMIIHFR